MHKPLKLVALTPCCVDFYPQLGKYFLGGNSLNIASMWKKLEPEAMVSVITCLGKDENGKMVMDFLKKRKIEHSRVYQKEGSTATNKLRVDEEGERFGIEGAWNGGVYETFHLSDNDWDWVSEQDIVAMPGNNPNFPEMLKRKHHKQVLAVDYLDIENQLVFENSFELTDIAFMAGRLDVISKYKEMAFEKKKLVVVTLGADGSYAFFKGKTYYQPAISVNQVIDTTGCGDAYQAAFSLNYFKDGDIQKAMNEGAQAASEILKYWGGVGNTN